MKTKVLIPTLLIGVLMAAGTALAGPFGNGPGNCTGGRAGQGPTQNSEEHQQRLATRMELMSTMLDLSDEQQAQISELLQAQWNSRQQQREQWQQEGDTMRTELTAADFNEAEFRAKALEQAQQRIDRMVEHAKLKQQIYQLLTPEQQEKVDQLSALQGKDNRPRHGFWF